ncbi:MAG: alpha/beta hydrolase fold domain-containing protein [Phycisphaerae bacterium]
MRYRTSVVTGLVAVALTSVVTLRALAAEPAQPAVAAAVKPAPAPLAGVRLISDLKYGDAPGKSNLLDIYLPKEVPAGGASLPLVVYIHGGGWRAGDKAPSAAAAFLAQHGYACASINYRFSQEAVFPAQLDDCKGAVRWLRAHAKEYGIDSERVGAWGSSAGAHLAALVATTAGDKGRDGTIGGNLEYSSAVKCVVDFYGPSDFVNMEAHAEAAKIVRDPKKISVLLGGSPVEKRELALAASPVNWVTKATPPFLILHGGADKTVPLAQSEVLAAALKKAGVEASLTVVPGAIHGAPFAGAKEREQVRSFFDQHLKGAAPARAE